MSRYEDLCWILVQTREGVYDEDGPLIFAKRQSLLEEEQEACLLVCELLPNMMNADAWLRLSPQQRIPWLERAVEAERKKRAAGAESTKPAKRTGRPRKGESNNDTKIIAALVALHHYKQDGSIDNRDPVKPAELVRVAEVNKMAVTRFMKKQFGNRGYKGYVAACLQNKIGYLLAAWQGDASKRLADLLSEEYGRPADA